jgi:hypothetical protein
VQGMPRKHLGVSIRRSVALAVALGVLAACSDGPNLTTGTDPVPAASTVFSTPPAMAGGHDCASPSPTLETSRGLEVQGTMRGGGELWALFDGANVLRSGSAITTYWRVAGNGALQITLVGSDDRIQRVPGVRPGVPPYEWSQPGEPWRSVITFPQPGCWRIYVQRGEADGEVWIEAS